MTEEEYYNALNDALEKFVTDPRNKKYMATLNAIEAVAWIILEHRELYHANLYVFKERLDLNKSISLVESFLHSFYPDYQEAFSSIIRDTNVDPETGKKIPDVNFVSSKLDDKDDSKTYPDGKADIYYQDTIKDAFVIVHEMFHMLNYFRSETATTDFLIESISIAAEFLLGDYLNNSKLNNSEINERKRNRLILTYDDVTILIFEKYLIDLYLRRRAENKKLTYEDSTLDFFNFDENSVIYRIIIERGGIMLNNIVDDGRIHFPDMLRYVFGLVVACDLHKRILNNPKEIETFKCLNHSLGDIDAKIVQVLKDNELDFFSVNSSGQAVVNERVIRKFRDSFNMEFPKLDIEESDRKTV